MVTDVGCCYLALALSSNPSSHLRELDLSYNHPQHSGLQMLKVSLINCALEKLNLDHGEHFRVTPGLRKYFCDLTLDPLQKTSSDAQPWTHHQCCFLDSQGVSGLATDTLLQATRPRLIKPRSVSKWHATAPTVLPSSTRAIWMLSLLPPHYYLWLFFGWRLLCPVYHMPYSGCGWQIPYCLLPLAYTWSSTHSSDTAPPAPGASFIKRAYAQKCA
ncbi:uncharacterized protein [Misgurnus anguillicaudatus]|uniref:uncharacterized protein n=1 Tax=Misgurnus anguillicaudatus TaxID=75329 RepID=UPI003CCF8FC8